MGVAKRLKNIGEYYFSQKLREIDDLNRQGKNVINLGIGSPDMPPHPDVIKVLNEESIKPNVHAYQSYKGSPVLRKAISEWYKKWYGVELDPGSEILPLIGSKEGIMHICMTYLNKGDEVLVPNPGYPTYTAAVKLTGGKCREYQLLEKNNYQPDLKKIFRKEFKKVKLMFVNYPHMPTGALPTKELFQKLVDFAKENDILIVHDNPYSFILPRWLSGDSPMSLLSIDGAKDCVLELNSLSKSHNMAGWRVGMLCGAKERIDEVLRFKSNMDSGMYLPVQLAAAKALTLEKQWYVELNKVYSTRREKVFELLLSLGCEFRINQAGLFIWARVSEKYKNGHELSDDLLSGVNVFVTPGVIFGSAGEKYIRVSLCVPDEKIADAIDRVRAKTHH